MGRHEKDPSPKVPQTVSEDTWTRVLEYAATSDKGEQWVLNALRCEKNARHN